MERRIYNRETTVRRPLASATSRAPCNASAAVCDYHVLFTPVPVTAKAALPATASEPLRSPCSPRTRASGGRHVRPPSSPRPIAHPTPGPTDSPVAPTPVRAPASAPETATLPSSAHTEFYPSLATRARRTEGEERCKVEDAARVRGASQAEAEAEVPAASSNRPQ